MPDPRTTELDDSHDHTFDPSSHVNGSWDTVNYGTGAPKTAQNHENYYRNRTSIGMEDDHPDGVSFPPLWKTSPSSSLHMQQHWNNCRFVSGSPRAQAIARGRRELMEMAKNMPETCYELSMKDLVEQQPRVEEEHSHQQQPRVEEEYSHHREKYCLDGKKSFSGESSNQEQKSKRDEKKGKVIVRSGSIDNGGLFLKVVVFPVSLGSKKKNKKKKNSEAANKGEERLKKTFSVSSEGEREESLRRSGSSSGCWTFLLSWKEEM